MFIWNRKEVYCGFSLDVYSKIIQALSDNKIKYAYKTVNYGKNVDFLTGTTGEDIRFRYMYYVYVHRKDFDYAVTLIK